MEISLFMRIRFHLGGLKMPLRSLKDAFEAPQCYQGAYIGSQTKNVAVAVGKSKYSCKSRLPAAEVLKQKKTKHL